ncbi:CHAP domain-containing protein [Enterococcus avium]|uniref:CHAP domain-containing protein n=1 Tax=Enterococcus avium TaxID=33945 RepID=UPI0028904DED|nr:CHAP domain-containing protein [Enterococcus avium]MDT2415006.1 CHAP domain-containing protein [Enterococcus avium]MDT2475596.1 CHAP domain-containing protein [Enterococcus avium]
MAIFEKGLNQLKSKLNQGIGNYQCYAVAAEFSGIMCGPDLGGGTYFDQLDPLDDELIYSASDIGIAYKWSEYGWSVIKNPSYEDLDVGSILCFERNVKISDDFTTHEEYGHCAVIRALENGMIQTYEQKGELGEIVAMYDRYFYGSETISSVIIPPDFSGEPTDFIHGQAPMEDAGKDVII